MKTINYKALFINAVQVFEVQMVGRTPVTQWLGRLVKARYIRIVPVEFRQTFYLRVEVLGCREGTTFKECCLNVVTDSKNRSY